MVHILETKSKIHSYNASLFPREADGSRGIQRRSGDGRNTTPATVCLNKLLFDLHSRYLTSADGHGSTVVELVGADVDIKMCLDLLTLFISGALC